MAAITDYPTLVEAVKATAEDDGLEFSNYIQTAVNLAEEMLFKDLDLIDLEVKATGSLSGGTATLSKPTGYRFAQYFRVTDTSSNRSILRKRSEDFLIDYWPNAATAGGVPKYYSDSSSTQFVLAPTPTLNYLYEIKYTAQPTPLSDAEPTNYFTSQCQDILFAATMLEMAKFMKAWTQVDVWQKSYDSLVAKWNSQEEPRRRRDGGETPESLTTQTNTIKGTARSES